VNISDMENSSPEPKTNHRVCRISESNHTEGNLTDGNPKEADERSIRARRITERNHTKGTGAT